MTDIFHEIEEDLRRERFRRLWDRFGLYVILLAVLVVLGAAAFSGYRWWTIRQEQAAGARFEAASQLVGAGKIAEAQTAFALLSKDATPGYQILARLRLAEEAARTDARQGVAAFDAIAADTSLSVSIRDLARVRAGLLLVDSAPLAEIEQRLKGLAESPSALRFSAREILALAQYRAGDLAAANKAARLLLEDPDVPAGVRGHADLLRALTAAAAQINPAADPSAPQ